MFTDQVTVELWAGKGGNGIVAWRREKYIPKGGPYGGDGGKGGSIVLEVDSQVSSLEALRYRSIMKAENGQQGGSNNCRGRNGRDLVIKIPCGTLVKDAESGEILYDLTKDGDKITLCSGGVGGKGNTHFKSPTNRAPNTATPGKPGEVKKIDLELKLIADVGLVGFPNAGKSTFIKQVTDIPVKIAPYPFTTLRPNLGFLIDENKKRLLLADIPGIIADAHKNRGLGFEFLRHIERTCFLIFVIDISGFEERDPSKDFMVLRKELGLYNPSLLEKPYAIVLNKMDLETAEKNRDKFRKKYTSPDIFEISALNGEGVEKVIAFLKEKMLKESIISSFSK